MSEILIKWLTVTAWCTAKYLVGIITAITFGFGFVEMFITTVGGGMIGVFIYLYVWELIVKVWQKYVPPKPKHGIKMSRQRRMIINLINKYDIYGIALITPVLISMPVGVLIAAMLEKNKWKIKLVMFIALTFWTILFYSLYRFFGIDIASWFQSKK